jgi:hypothetical protein
MTKGKLERMLTIQETPNHTQWVKEANKELICVLNEARKDFPMELWMEDNHNLTQEQKDKIDCECNRQTLHWFDKWFGKVKEVKK